MREHRLTTLLTNHGGTVVLIIVLTASLSLNLVAARRFGWSIGTRRVDPIGAITLGEPMPVIPATALDGSRVSLTFVGPTPTLVYVMSPRCGWCAKNYDNIVGLAARIRSRYHLIGLSTNGTLADLKGYLSATPMPFDVFVVDDKAAANLPFAVMTPTTLAITPAGHIERAWVGAFDDAKLQDLRQFFGDPLAGLAGVVTLHR